MVKSQLSSLLEISSSRGRSLGKLNQALRSSGNVGILPNNYEMVCSTVQRELSEASDKEAALRSDIHSRDEEGSLYALNWIDKLMDLEKKQLISLVSLHALQRSKEANPTEDATDASKMESNISNHAQALQRIDSDMGDLLAEIREFVSGAE